MILGIGKKIQCCECNKKDATWCYMPSPSSYYCDDCVTSKDSMGCSCNWNYSLEQEGLPTDLPEGEEGKDWRWIIFDDGDGYVITKEDGYWQNLDKLGRPHPCVEYDYEEDGFKRPTFYLKIYWYLSSKLFWFKHDIKKVFKRIKRKIK